MAIYHYSSQVIGRKDNHNAVAASAYRSGSKLTTQIIDKETGISVERTFDYSNKKNVAYSNILTPKDAPKWAKDRNKLWNEVERVEKRKDSQLAREINIALPKELTLEQNKELIKDYVQEGFVDKGMVADYSIHNEPNNPHVHIMTTMRNLHKHGFGNKNRSWNSKMSLVEARSLWAEHANKHLKAHNIDARIDHRSYKERGIDLVAMIHEGVQKVGSGWKSKVEENEKIRLENLERVKQDPEIILKKLASENVTFTKGDLAKEVFNLTLGNEEEFESVYSKIIYSESTKLVTNFDARGEQRYVFVESKEVEEKLWNNIDDLLKNDSKAPNVLSSSDSDEFTKIKSKLSQEQRKAVENIVSDNNLSVLVGRAGTGKTTTLEAVANYYNMLGRDVKGAAISGIASDNLSSDNIDSRTVAKWLRDFEKGYESLGKKDVFIIDEASMLDTESLQSVLEKASEAKAKVILVGDDLQLQPIGAGSPFRSILEKYSGGDVISTLSQVWRQRDPLQANLSNKMAERDVDAVVKGYEKAGKINWAENQDLAIIKLSQEYVRECVKDYSKNLQAITFTDNASREINLLVRDGLKDAGILKEEREYLTKNGIIDVAVGEKILFLQNDSQLGVRNGQSAEVLKISKNSLKVAFKAKGSAEPKTLSFSMREYNNFSYAYSVTTHKSQSQSVDKTFVLAEVFHNFNSFYVALTRHIKDIAIYVNKEAHSNLDSLLRSITKENFKEVLSDYDVKNDSERAVVKEYLEGVEGCRNIYSEISEWADKENKGFKSHKKWGKYISALKHRESLAKRLSDNKDLYRPAVMQAGLSYSAIDNHAGKIKRELSNEQQKALSLVQEYAKTGNSEIAYIITHDLPKYSRHFGECGLKMEDVNSSKDSFIKESSKEGSLTSRMASLAKSSNQEEREEVVKSVTELVNKKSALDKNISNIKEDKGIQEVRIMNLTYKNELYTHNDEKSSDNPKYKEQIKENQTQIDKLKNRLSSLVVKEHMQNNELKEVHSKLGYFADAPKALERAVGEVTQMKDRDVKIMQTDIQNASKELKKPSSELIKSDKGASLKIIPSKIDYKDLHDKFVSNPSNISAISKHLLGSHNKQLSNSKELRFGENGKILVNLSGDKAGLWYDFSRDVGGNIYTLLREERGLSLKEAGNYIKELSGDYDKSQVRLDGSPIFNNKEKLEPLHKLDKQSGYDATKQAKVDQILSSTTNIEKTVAATYLKDHRGIDLSKINLSEDIRFSKSIYSSEDQKDHPALIAVARNGKGEARAVQSIYLDNEGRKDSALNIKKRSNGNLKGSFVELTQNKSADRIYIAEGVETALSIANADPEARVICSLGITNIKNIDLNNTEKLYSKEVIICADNDNKGSQASETIEKAALSIKETHDVKYVSIIKPEEKGFDFNDVLQKDGLNKVKEYIQPYNKDFSKVYKDLKSGYQHNDKLYKEAIKSLDVIYKDSTKVLDSWNGLVKEHGIEKAESFVKDNPTMLGDLKGSNFLGVKNHLRVNAEEQKGVAWEHLSEVTELRNIQQNISKEIQVLENSYIKPLYEFNPTQLGEMNKDHISKEYESLITKAACVKAEFRDVADIKELASKITDHVTFSGKTPAGGTKELSSKEISSIIDKQFKEYGKIISDRNYLNTRDNQKDYEKSSSRNLDIEKVVDDNSKFRDIEREINKDERE